MPLEPGTYLVRAFGELSLVKVIEVDRFLDSQNVLYWYWANKPELILSQAQWCDVVVMGKVINKG